MQRNKDKGKKKSEAAPLSFDQLIDEAVESEEKGERYKDGEKAKRFFEAAAENYAAASALTRDAACEYNLGRILLLLAEFKFPAYPPQQRKRLLLDSIARLRGAIALDNATNADCLFNLAQAIRARFEDELDDLDGPSLNMKLFEDALEADKALDAAFLIQREELRKAIEMKNEACGPGCGDHGHDHSHANQETLQNDSNQDSSMDQDEGGDEEEGFEVVTEETPITNETLIETLVAHASLLTLVGSALLPVSKDQAESAFIRAEAKLAETRVFWTDAAVEPSDVGLARAALLVAQGEAVFEMSPKTEEASSAWTGLFEKASAVLDHVLALHPTCAEAPADKGDLQCTWAESVMTCAIGSSGAPGFEALANSVSAENQMAQSGGSSSSSSAPQQQQQGPATVLLVTLRQMYAAAAASYKAAQTIEPGKANVSCRLGDLEATRTALYPSDTKTRNVLFNNAATHYKRAIDALGVSMNLLSVQKPCPDDEVARTALLGLAKALSHLEGREGDVKTALVCWKRRGGELTDSESAIYFGERVLALEWFEKLV
ncbi:hypothetical protein HDU78_004248 [Chytriomyces hyalinus]|nr:hypothetical protein HDU78_004248 [Chytriomyces hyalinus]KAJ3263015.1 hypothetical protein HDU77_011437 [Chytriomyces hyalinus]